MATIKNSYTSDNDGLSSRIGSTAYKIAIMNKRMLEIESKQSKLETAMITIKSAVVKVLVFSITMIVSSTTILLLSK